MRKFIVLFLAAGLFLFPAQSAWSADTQPDQSLRRGENRETLYPGQFSHPTVQAAYIVARRIPWVLDSIYCYCYCEENRYFMHKSLLSCYVDDHAST